MHRNVNWYNAKENSMEVAYKTENKVTIRSSNPNLGHISGKDEYASSKNYTHPSVHSSTIYNRQDMEAM